MATITDFDEWLNEADPEGHEEIYALYRAVIDIDKNGMYECSVNNGKYFVKCDHAISTLLLASEKAYTAFLEEINLRFELDGNIEGWDGLKRAIAKDD